MKGRKICKDPLKIAKMCLNMCFFVNSACCTSIPNSFSRKASARIFDKFAVCPQILRTLDKYLEKCKHLKNNWRKWFHIKMLIVLKTLCARIPMHCWRQASARKIAKYALLQASQHIALFFTWTMQSRNIVFENSPQELLICVWI